MFRTMNRFVKSLKVAPELFYFWLLQIFATGSLFLSSLHFIHVSKVLTDTGENVQKWTRVFSTRHWVRLVARTRRKKREENSVSTFGRFRLWTSFESSPVSVKLIYNRISTLRRSGLKTAFSLQSLVTLKHNV